MLEELVTRTRSIRRFKQDEPVSVDSLKKLVNLARLSPTGGNQQSLRFVLSADAKKNALVFAPLMWAASLKDWPGPAEGERPAGYVIILGDTAVSKSFGQNAGIAAHAILLGATEMGLAGCMLGAITRPQLRENLGIPERYEILLVIALGPPAETVVIDECLDGNTTYWRDERGRHHVPKLPLASLILDL